jgi:hypothetical protein
MTGSVTAIGPSAAIRSRRRKSTVLLVGPVVFDPGRGVSEDHGVEGIACGEFEGTSSRRYRYM